MVDQEVQNILQEIRDRVRRNDAELTNFRDATLKTTVSSDSVPTLEPSTKLFAGLTTLARAWDRLPPVISNRTGSTARIELWIKARLKRLLRWITWEQVNFNAAVHHTLIEVVESLARQEGQLRLLTAYVPELNSFRTEFHQLRTELAQVLRDSNTSQLNLQAIRAELASHRREITDIAETQLLELVNRCEGLQTQRNEISAELLDLKSRLESVEAQTTTEVQQLSTNVAAARTQLASLLGELRQRDDRLLEEQRVCIKQLSLETGEVAVIQDRLRRQLEARLERLEATRNKASSS